MNQDSAQGYGIVQIGLHWVSAVAVLLLVPLGLWMTGLDYYDPWYQRAPELHRAIGVLAGVLLVLRLAWRWTHTQPPLLAATAWERAGARLAHALLYLVPLLAVLSGYLVSSADGRSVAVFDWFAIPATLHGLEGQADIAGEIHFMLSMVLLAIVALHAAASLRHHLVHRDATLRRMLKPKPHP